ncbi:hypothetical protein ISCGN_029725 [Ixodes scapularis]
MYYSYKPENADYVVMTTCILHNVLREDSIYMSQSCVDSEDAYGNVKEGQWREILKNEGSAMFVLKPPVGHNFGGSAGSATDLFRSYFNSKREDEHWIADIAKRRIDILVHPTVLDEKYWQLLHFPRVFYYRRIDFYTVRKPSRRAGAFIRKAPMAFFTILFLSMVTCALGFCLINYCSGRGLVNGIQDVVLVLVSTAMLFSYPVPERFQRVLAGRIVLFCWMAGGFQLAVYFQSLLTSSLSSGYVWEADDTIEKLYSRLASGKVLPCVLKGSYFDRLLLQTDDKQGIIGAMAAARRRSSNKNSTVCDTTKECMKKVLGGSHVFLSHEKHECFIAKHGNRLTSGKDTIHQLYASTPVRKDLPLRNSYGQLVARMFETGLLPNRMSLHYWNCSRIRDMQVSLVPFDATQFRRVYYLCCGAATIVFVVELGVAQREQRQQA